MPTFINPSLLAGVLLIGIPIALHLMMKQKPQRLMFPALQFVKQRRESNQRRLKLRHLLLLLLRCAAIALLALALARPQFNTENLPAGNAPVATAIVFDTSSRMAYREFNQTRLDIAQEKGRWLIKQLPSASKFVVLDSTSTRSGFDVDRGAAILRLDQLQVAPATRPLSESIENAYTVLAKSTKPTKELFVFTDLSEAAWNRESQSRLASLMKEAPEVSVHLFDVGATEPRNVALGELQLSAQTVSTNGTVDLTYDLLATGDGSGAHAVEVYLLDSDGKSQRRGLETVQLGDNGSAFGSARLSLPPESGIHHGYVTLARHDNLAIDDVRYFSVEARPAWRVLIASPEPVSNYTRMLKGVLAPEDFRKRDMAQFDCETVSLAELGRRDLNAFQAVWILDPGPLSTEAWQRLSRYVNAGGSVAFAFGRNARRGEAFNHPTAQQLLPGTLARQWNIPDGDLRISPDNLEHPILSRFKPVAASVPWDLNPIYKFWQLSRLDDGAHPILTYDNGRPTIVEQEIGQGLVLTITTPLSDELNDRDAWNHLLAPRRQSWPGFLLAIETTHYLIGNSRSVWNYQVGETAELRVDESATLDQYLLTSPGGDTSRVAVDQRDGAIRVMDTHWPGRYELQSGGAAGDRLGFSVNLNPRETQLARVTAEQFKQTLGGATPPIVRNEDQLQRSRRLAAGRGTWEAYPWLIVLIVFIAAGEQLVSSLFYQRGRASSDLHPSAARPSPLQAST